MEVLIGKSSKIIYVRLCKIEMYHNNVLSILGDLYIYIYIYIK